MGVAHEMLCILCYVSEFEWLCYIMKFVLETLSDFVLCENAIVQQPRMKGFESKVCAYGSSSRGEHSGDLVKRLTTLFFANSIRSFSIQVVRFGVFQFGGIGVLSHASRCPYR